MTEHEDFVRAWLTQKLRRLSYQFPYRKNLLRRARVSRGKYKCAMCEEAGIETLYGPKEINLDHIDPVVQVEFGFIDWNTYIGRLFCPEENWQVLCKDHHNTKSFLENELRKSYKEDKKNG